MVELRGAEAWRHEAGIKLFIAMSLPDDSRSLSLSWLHSESLPPDSGK